MNGIPHRSSEAGVEGQKQDTDLHEVIPEREGENEEKVDRGRSPKPILIFGE